MAYLEEKINSLDVCVAYSVPFNVLEEVKILIDLMHFN
jgi:hypothetical protein